MCYLADYVPGNKFKVMENRILSKVMSQHNIEEQVITPP